jgi:hypothetical protein
MNESSIVNGHTQAQRKRYTAATTITNVIDESSYLNQVEFSGFRVKPEPEIAPQISRIRISHR